MQNWNSLKHIYFDFFLRFVTILLTKLGGNQGQNGPERALVSIIKYRSHSKALFILFSPFDWFLRRKFVNLHVAKFPLTFNRERQTSNSLVVHQTGKEGEQGAAIFNRISFFYADNIIHLAKFGRDNEIICLSDDNTLLMCHIRCQQKLSLLCKLIVYKYQNL